MNSYNYSYNVLINRLEAFAAGHLLIKRFTHGQIDLADMDQDEQYPFMHVVPNNIKPVDGGMQFDFQIIFADIPRDKEVKAEYQREVISDCVRLAQDLISEVKNGLVLFGFDVQLVTPPVIEPFMEEYKNTLTGVTFSLQLEVPWDWSACDIPAVWAVGGSSSGGSGSPIGIVLRTNGVDNAVQNILDLVAGTNITITDNGDGSVTFDASGGGGGGGGPYVSTQYNTNHTTALGNPYLVGDRVWYNGSVYACIANNDAINPTNPTYWTLQAVGFRLRQSPVDWNASSGDYQILNKPTIPAAQVNSDWNAVGSVAEILNKPTIPSGTVTSVGLTMPAAFGVTGSPVTTAGTLAVTGAGLVSQYIDGTGALQTFPTIPATPTIFQYEIHVSQVDGNDTTGNGDLVNPVASITKALTLLTGSRKTIIVHPGTYTENVTVANTNTTISTTELTGANTLLSGTLTIGSSGSGTRISGLKMSNLVISGTAQAYISNCTVDTQVTKSSSGYVEIINSEMQCTLGIQISGAGVTIINGNKNVAVAVSNVSAQVIIKGCNSVVTPSASAGNLAIVDCIVTALGGNGVTITGGSTTLTLINSQVLVQAGNNVAPISVAGIYSIINTIYDKPNSSLTGTTTNSIDYFQFINADKFVKQGGSASQYLMADGSVTTLTTVGTNLATLPDPSAVRYLRINADNTVSALTLAQLKTDLSLGSDITVVAASNVVTVGTAFEDVTGLSFAVTSGKTYKWRATISFGATSGTYLFSSNGPTTSINNARFTMTTGATTNGVSNQVAYDSGTNVTGSSNGLTTADGIVRVTANGTFVIRFRSSVAGALTVRAGSVLEYSEVL